jgi:hypothetical protein
VGHRSEKELVMKNSGRSSKKQSSSGRRVVNQENEGEGHKDIQIGSEERRRGGRLTSGD